VRYQWYGTAPCRGFAAAAGFPAAGAPASDWSAASGAVRRAPAPGGDPGRQLHAARRPSAERRLGLRPGLQLRDVHWPFDLQPDAGSWSTITNIGGTNYNVDADICVQFGGIPYSTACSGGYSILFCGNAPVHSYGISETFLGDDDNISGHEDSYTSCS